MTIRVGGFAAVTGIIGFVKIMIISYAILLV